MRYRTKSEGKGLIVTVEDGGEVLASKSVADRKEADALTRAASRNGWQEAFAPAPKKGK